MFERSTDSRSCFSETDCGRGVAATSPRVSSTVRTSPVHRMSERSINTVVSKRFHSPGTATALEEVGAQTPADVLATYLTDRAGLEAYAGDALPVTDDRPRIEYTSLVRPGPPRSRPSPGTVSRTPTTTGSWATDATSNACAEPGLTLPVWVFQGRRQRECTLLSLFNVQNH